MKIIGKTTWDGELITKVVNPEEIHGACDEFVHIEKVEMPFPKNMNSGTITIEE